MGRSSSVDAGLAEEARGVLLDVARRSITSGVAGRGPLAVDIASFTAELRASRATFVTLLLREELRGCIGTLEAVRPLVDDVARNAYAAAFRDPRFPPLTAREAPELALHISILQPPAPMDFSDERDLLAQIRPGVDGLVLEDGPYRGTFLPSVWDQLPARDAFWSHLKRKAGLPEDYWSDTLRVYRYTTEEFGG